MIDKEQIKEIVIELCHEIEIPDYYSYLVSDSDYGELAENIANKIMELIDAKQPTKEQER